MKLLSKNNGKMIGFIIALVLFIIANFILARIDGKMKALETEIADIEKNQEYYLRNILLGKEDFRMGEFYITLGLMTTDGVHPVAGIFNPVATSMSRGLKSLNETLPRQNQSRWSMKIEALVKEFQSAADRKNFAEFIKGFAKANELFRQLAGESDEQNESLAKKKEQSRKKLSNYHSTSGLLLTINTVILLIQLFFNNFYEMYMERREAQQKK